MDCEVRQIDARGWAGRLCSAVSDSGAKLAITPPIVTILVFLQ
jgi:hypothetical protein